MTTILTYMKTANLAPPPAAAEAMATELAALSDLHVYRPSISAAQHKLFFLGKRNDQKYLGILAAGMGPDNSFRGDTKAVTIAGSALNLTIAPANAANAAALRQILPFLKAQPLGLKKSAGCGDRLGLATPGHIRAIRKSTMAPILAQQSMRENARTGRTPQEVLDDAMWGVFQEGWRNGFGADADHLKTTADIDVCAAAGYTFYTVDPGDYVDNNANHASLNEVRHKVQDLPWHRLDSNPDDLQKRLAGKKIELGDFSLTINQPDLLRAAAKYGAAVAHTAKMYRHLVRVMGQRPFELEMSVDETDTVTTPLEHIYIANELRRLGVKWVSLAPRYVGDFEKGVDYIGDLAAFERAFAGHMAVAKAFGPYKLSLHSGSDKFSIYPIVSKVAGDLVHLKTAGTSYLEALRAIAKLKPELFREIVAFALERYPTDRATYHVSAEIEKVPGITTLLDESLPTLLENFHGREVLHVTFGSVLNHLSFRAPMFAALRGDEDAYYQVLEAHFDRHLAPFG